MSPSGRLQSLVGALVPPSSREHVLGDLYERVSREPAARVNRVYAREAAALLPWVVWSELRTAIGMRAIVSQTALIFIGFVFAVLTTTEGEVGGFLFRDAGLARLVIPVVAVALGMIGQEIYAPGPWTQTEQMVPILLACGGAGLVELALVILAPAWTLPRLMFEWSTINALIYLPIAQFSFPRGGRRLRLVSGIAEQAIDTFVRDIRRRTWVGAVVSITVMIACAGLAFLTRNDVERSGAILSLLASAYILRQCLAYRLRSAPADGGRHDMSRDRFAEELRRQRRFHSGRLLWTRFFIALPGPVLFCWSQWLEHRGQSGAIFSDAVAFLTIWTMSVPLNWARAQRYGREMSALTALDRPAPAVQIDRP